MKRYYPIVERLKVWSKKLNITIDQCMPEFLEAFEGKKQLHGYPSKESMAAEILQRIKDELDEVNSAFNELEIELFK